MTLYKSEDYIDDIIYAQGTRLETASLYDICEWFIETYPEDVYVVNPPDIVQIRDIMQTIPDRRDKV